MQLSARGRYAVMAMVDLAARAPVRSGASSSVPLAEIALGQRISLAYLEQIFCRLRRAGLVLAVRGPGGGYRLARAPAEIAIIEIIRGSGEPIRTTRCRPGGLPCPGSSPALPGARCRTHALWAALGHEIERFLGSVTLADVLAGHPAIPAAAA
ncbi:MAG: Rrf2 family transcriptional regulator [Rhodospirillales bacterium]|nr:Rrf2 family transcriptional regulator [Rhodospirillales bacterium]